MINEAIKQFVDKSVQQQETIIEEIARQGYKYLVMKKEYFFVEDTAKIDFKYKGYNSLEGLNFLENEGYEVFDITKVNEYLKQRDLLIPNRI